MDTRTIISKLEYFDGTFPTEAILDAINYREQIIPELLKILQATVQDTDTILKQEDYLGHIYAMFLLAQFRISDALPWLVGFFSLSEDVIWELTGDIVTEDLGRILASVCSSDIAPIQEMIENSANESLIRAAGVDALLSLVVSRELSRESVIEYFRSLYREKLEKKHSLIWDHLVVSSINIYPEELIEEIKEAFQQSLADEDFISYQQVTEALESGKDRVLTWLFNNPSYQLIEDTMVEIKKWIPTASEAD